MKTFLLKILFAFLIVIAISQTGFSQDTELPEEIYVPPKTEARMFDNFGKICSEDLMNRYDGYMVELQNDPTATGYIVFYGDQSVEGRNLKFITYLTEFYPNIRKFDKSRIVLVRGENQSEQETQFWLVPAGAEPPKPEKHFIKNPISETALFDKNRADFYKSISGKTEIYSEDFLELGCEFGPNVPEYAKILLANEDLTGYLVIYGNKKARAEKVVRFAVNDLVKNYKVPRNRLKTVYGGKSEEPQIEFWFVPKNSEPPKSVSNIN